MDVNGCHVIPEPSDKNPEGFSTTVHRGKEIRGPFATIQEAIKCAASWIVSETASDNDAVQFEMPKEQPPVVPVVSVVTAEQLSTEPPK